MDTPCWVTEDDEQPIVDYLARNCRFHMSERTTTWHSWPCGIWMDSGSVHKDINWTDLFCHGLIPRNWKLITCEPY